MLSATNLFCRQISLVSIVAIFAVSCGGGGSSTDGADLISLTPIDIDSASSLPEARFLQGGDTTVFDRTALAFENPAPNLSEPELDRHLEGDASFGAKFVSPPAIENPGLGPLFNNTSCEGCHTKNGRGQPVFGSTGLGSQAVIKISNSSGLEEAPGGSKAVENLGTQIQDHATFGVNPEAAIELDYEFLGGSYGDGEPYELRRPVVSIELNDGSRLADDVMTSFRTAPPVFGLGLIDALPDEAITLNEDPTDQNQDGISGRANRVWDLQSLTTRLGRFGRKAGRVNVLQQTAGAYLNDMGVENSIFKNQDDNSPEIDDNILTSAEFYVQTLAVPGASRIIGEDIKRGEKVFVAFNCAACHRPEFTTGEHIVPALSNQRIFPYSDFLLHDLGEGLADNRPEFQADGKEWRTSPLWGIGITATILSNTANFLHDGRARSLEEAILWHGGEALESKERFRQADKADRDALVAFLKSL